MNRHFPIRTLITALIALLFAGCQSAVFGIANIGAAKPSASVLYDAERGLSLDIYKSHLNNTPAPVVVFFYGGGWKHGTRDQYRFVGSRLAEQGVLAIVADYRTFPSTTFPGFVEDGARAVAWSRQHAVEYGGDAGRLFVAGHSAGAQIAALIGTDARYLLVNGMKPLDLAGVIGLSGPYDFGIDDEYAPVFGPREQWPLAQAVNFVDGDEPPFLLIHGTNDQVVETKDSPELAEKLKAKGGHAVVLLLPDGGHSTPLTAIYRTKRDSTVMNAMIAFINNPK